MKNLLTLTQLNSATVRVLIDLATDMKRISEARSKKGPQMLGRTLVCVGEDDFDFTGLALAYQYLGGTTFVVNNCSDIINTAQKYANFGASLVAVRAKSQAAVTMISEKCCCPVLNASSDTTNPIETLSILATLLNCFDSLDGKTVALFGYKKKSAANELIKLLRVFKAAALPYFPYEKSSFYDGDVIIGKSIDSILSEADAIIDFGVKTRAEYADYYGDKDGISEEFLKKTKPEIPLLGARTTSVGGVDVEYPYNKLDRQEKNYVACCMAVLYYFYR